VGAGGPQGAVGGVEAHPPVVSQLVSYDVSDGTVLRRHQACHRCCHHCHHCHKLPPGTQNACHFLDTVTLVSSVESFLGTSRFLHVERIQAIEFKEYRGEKSSVISSVFVIMPNFLDGVSASSCIVWFVS